MKNTPFLSFIIPVYNVENYICECLNSILTIDFNSYEIIIVIGKSSDNSDIICKKYSNEYHNISIINQTGKGLSNARNCGLQTAKGTYVTFIDSDDYINPSKFQRTIREFYSIRDKHYDFLISDFILINNSDVPYKCRNQIKDTQTIIQNCDYVNTFLSKRENYWNVWRFIYRHDFLNQNKLLFLENFKSEDIDFSTKVFLSMKTCCFYHNPYYCYRVRRAGSLVNVITIQNVDNLMHVLSNCIQAITNDSSHSYNYLLTHKLSLEYFFSFLLIRDISPIQKSNAFEKIKANLFLLNTTPSCKFLYILARLLGINSLSYFLYLLRQARRSVLKIK